AEDRRAAHSPQEAGLLLGGSCSTVEKQTRGSVLVTTSGATPDVSLGSQRLSSSKGHTRRDARAQRDRCGSAKAQMAALPKGWTSGETTVHPATYGKRTARRGRPIRG